jgi:hypothetical protein
MGKSWHVGIDIGRLLMVYGRTTEVRLLSDTTRSFTKFINQKVSLLRVCLIVLRMMERVDYKEYELTLKLKLAYLMFSFCISNMCSSFDCFWAKTL